VILWGGCSPPDSNSLITGHTVSIVDATEHALAKLTAGLDWPVSRMSRASDAVDLVRVLHQASVPDLIALLVRRDEDSERPAVS
jgi:hypothetical protein